MQFHELVTVFEQLNKNPKRLAKTDAVSKFLRTVPEKDTDDVIHFFSGRVFPEHDERHLGFSTKLAIKAIALAAATQPELVEETWKNEGDLGIAAEKILAKKRQKTLFGSAELTIKKVAENLRKLATQEGSGSVDQKLKLVAELLTSANPLEARYIIRSVLEDLRVGLGDGGVRDAIIWAYFGEQVGLKYDEEKNKITVEKKEEYDAIVEEVQMAYDLTVDFAEVVRTIKTSGRKGLTNVELKPGRPVKVMLYQKADTIKEAFETVGTPASIEYKYDGFRILIHRDAETVKLFTRRLEDVSVQFPDVVALVKKHITSKHCILDGEVVGIDKKTKRSIAFQQISQRIKRKYGIEKMVEELPIEVVVFDVLYADGKTITAQPYQERKALLTKLVKNPAPGTLRLADASVVEDEQSAEKFYQEALAAGNEGVMFKNLAGIYKPGARVGYGVKVKPTLETLQLVIVGAEWGTGKRGNWLSSVILACKGEDGELLELGRVSTGLKDKEEEGFSYGQLTELLKPLITEEQGREVRVKPALVVQVDYEEIQSSPSYTSGFALRFPRFVGFREDLGPEDINTIQDVQRFYNQQRGRDNKQNKTI